MPTEAGRAAYTHAAKIVRDHEDKLFAHMTAEEKTTLVALLRKIRDGGNS